MTDISFKRDTACAECMFGTGDEGFVVTGFQCDYHKRLRQPEAPFAKESKSLGGLIRKIEELFECRDGPYQAWVEIDGGRIPYVSMGILCRCNDPEVGAEKLRNAMLHVFLQIRDQFPADSRPLLYWRYAPDRRMDEDVEKIRGAGHWVTKKIFTRVAIPGVDWTRVDCARYPIVTDETPYPRIE